jgi:hypothetical protein
MSTAVATLPWWAVPAITAGATVFGALVAFFSAMWSDHRKRKGEDRRQWDKEIRDIYVDVAKCLNAFDALRLRVNYADEADLLNPSHELRESKRTAAQEHNTTQYPQIPPIEAELQSIYDRAEIIVDDDLLKEIDGIMAMIETIRTYCHDGIYFRTNYTDLVNRRKALLKRAKTALRRR